MKTIGVLARGVLLAAALPIAGCGGNSAAVAPSGSSALTQAQALQMTSDLFAALAGAPLVAGGTPQARLGQIAARVRTATETDAPAAIPVPRLAPESTVSTTIPPFTYACPAGGTIVVTGSFTGNYSVVGTTVTDDVTENIVEMINNCGEQGFTINGDPDIQLTANVSLAGNIFTDLTTISGGFTVGKNSCAMNVTISATVNETTGAETGSVTGSVCGVTVNGTI